MQLIGSLLGILLIPLAIWSFVQDRTVRDLWQTEVPQLVEMTVGAVGQLGTQGHDHRPTSETETNVIPTEAAGAQRAADSVAPIERSSVGQGEGSGSALAAAGNLDSPGSHEGAWQASALGQSDRTGRHVFWPAFGTSKQAEGFRDHLTEETGLELEVIQQHDRHEVVLLYRSELQRESGLEKLSAATGVPVR